ncbi:MULTISPECIES: hypothetical protein [unclassified Aureimonas]|uniref:hypothetical protein n=1 Tax=unclassified Aureimonas TaxID=2615206 RepID=UPI000721C63F|nr:MULTISPECIES: hypothetical protein [unclassified Aureimonas]ALN75658.1 hypothetical protein M673_23215 [Aureimonas sp. AU20]
MASLKDLDVISNRSDARLAEAQARVQDALNRQIIWIVGIAFFVVGAIAAIVKL